MCLTLLNCSHLSELLFLGAKLLLQQKKKCSSWFSTLRTFMSHGDKYMQVSLHATNISTIKTKRNKIQRTTICFMLQRKETELRCGEEESDCMYLLFVGFITGGLGIH